MKASLEQGNGVILIDKYPEQLISQEQLMSWTVIHHLFFFAAVDFDGRDVLEAA